MRDWTEQWNSSSWGDISGLEQASRRPRKAVPYIGRNDHSCDRNAMEAEAACVVLGDRVLPRGASSSVNSFCSLDHQVDSRNRNCAFWDRRFVPDALGSFGLREVHGRTDDH